MTQVTRNEARAGLLAGRRVPVAVIAVLIVVAIALVVLYARGGGPVPDWLGFLGPDDAGLLEPSSPEETVLRSLRLAGYEHAVVGEDGGTVVVRLDVPAVRTSADVELSWQTGLGCALAAFPEAGRYVAQVFADGTPYVEVGIEGADLRAAMDTPDHAAALWASADVVLLPDPGTAP